MAHEILIASHGASLRGILVPNGGRSMSDSDKTAKRGPGQDQLFPDRAGLIMYLQYALEDLAEIDKTSAALIEKVIMNLRDSHPQMAARNYVQ
jgi:hypothetical protein